MCTVLGDTMAKRSTKRRRRREVPKTRFPHSWEPPHSSTLTLRSLERSLAPVSPYPFRSFMERAPLALSTTPSSYSGGSASSRPGSANLNKSSAFVLRQPALPARSSSLKTICESRADRRRAMFSSGSAGKSGQRSPVFTASSSISCRRKK